MNAIASGGTAPYTYAWRRVGGSTRVRAIDATSSSTGFTGFVEEFHGYSATFVCKVTDSVGTQVDTSNSVFAVVGPE